MTKENVYSYNVDSGLETKMKNEIKESGSIARETLRELFSELRLVALAVVRDSLEHRTPYKSVKGTDGDLLPFLDDEGNRCGIYYSRRHDVVFKQNDLDQHELVDHDPVSEDAVETEDVDDNC